jgi:CRP/FNR family transcriptional regulator, anaerobic regulatory protein
VAEDSHQTNFLPSLNCSSCVLRDLCLAKGLANIALASFDGIVVHPRPIQKGKHLYRQEEPHRSVYIVSSGAIKTYRLSKDGNEQIQELYLPGELVSCTAFTGSHYTESAVALDTTLVCELPMLKLSRLIASDIGITSNVLSLLADNVINERRQRILAHKTTDVRVAAFLANLAERQKQRQMSEDQISLPMSRNDIANYLVIAVETLSRVLKRFQQKGWITSHRREVTILDRASIDELLQAYRDETGL